MKKILTVIITLNFQLAILNMAPAFATGDIYTHTSMFSSGQWAKIGVTQTGINAITPSLIKKAGFNDMSRIKVYGYGGAVGPDELTEDYLKTHDDIQEIPTFTADTVKYFYGNGPVTWVSKDADIRSRNVYADYGGYFITEGDSPAACTEAQLLQTANDNGAAYHSLSEPEECSPVMMGGNLFAADALTLGAGKTYNVTVPAAATAATVNVTFVSPVSKATYSVSSPLYGGVVQEGVFDKLSTHGVMNLMPVTFSLTTEQLADADKDSNGDYIIPVTISNAAEGYNNRGTLYPDFISVTYNASNVPLTVKGHSFPQPQYISLVNNHNRHADEPCDLIVIIPSSAKALQQAQRLCQLHQDKDGITTRIVKASELYDEFSSGTPDIAAYRRYLKMLYDRANLQPQTSNLQPQTSNLQPQTSNPKWVLLFGKSYFDNRLITIKNHEADDLLLVSENDDLYDPLTGTVRSCEISETASVATDDYITCLQDSHYMSLYANSSTTPSFDIAVGRLPASNNTEAKVYVDKIEHYMDPQYNGSWQRDIMFIGSCGKSTDSNPLIHIRQINENAELLIGRHLGYNVTKILQPAYTPVTTSIGDRYPELTKMIRTQQNNGALVMNFGGHAGSTHLTQENVLTIQDFKDFKGEHYSIWFTACCGSAAFDLLSDNIGQTAIDNANGGAIAFIGTTRTVFANYNTILNKTLMYHLLNYIPQTSNLQPQTSNLTPQPITLGEAMRLAKNSILTGDYEELKDPTVNKYNYVLLGDPALKVNLPADSIVIDDVTGEKGQNDSIAAMENMVIRGHITGRCASSSHDYGKTTLFVKVNDSEVEETCTFGEDFAYSYNIRKNTLFDGVTTIDGNSFCCTLRIPKSINNNGGKAQLVFYAVDNGNPQYAAIGEYTEAEFSGYKTIEGSVGQPATQCYIGSNLFHDGDTIPDQSTFFAEVQDDMGILMSSDVGHNMELQIDGKASLTYDMTPFFSFDYDNDTQADFNTLSGIAAMTLPSLAEGYHTARFRVWNILDSLTTNTLHFVVGNRNNHAVVHALTPLTDITDVTAALSEMPRKRNVTVLQDGRLVIISPDGQRYNLSGAKTK